MAGSYPAYVELWERGELAERARRAVAMLADCALCGRQCHADRLEAEHAASPGVKNKKAPFCRTGRLARVSSAFAHHGEENCLRGNRGSGTIFFSHCNLRCVFCQNYEISSLGEGRPAAAEELADVMLRLQARGCHNVNFVTPSHVVPQILEALDLAVAAGLRLPLVYNTGGYDRVETLRLLDGVVDVYMPDFKFWSSEVGRELAAAEDYREIACAAIREMHRQVGDLTLDEQGVARRGLLVRHLVMPDDQAGTREVMRFLAREISPDTYVNVMAQYHPAGQAFRHRPLDRAVSGREWADAVAAARQEGLRRFDER